MDNETGERDENLNPRSCIVTREKEERTQLLRFVIGPDGSVVPDIKGNLPGRGVWTKLNKEIVAQAITKGHFSRGFKQKVAVDENLADLTGKLLGDRALQALAMAKKAGVLVTGFSKVDSTIRSGKAALLLHATDAAADGKRKLASAIAFVGHMEGDKVELFDVWSIEEMSRALGVENAVHVAATYGGATKNLVTAIRRMNTYMGGLDESPEKIAKKDNQAE